MAETKSALMVYEARDGQTIELTFDRIKRYLVQGHPEFVTPAEFMYFMGVAKSGGMNPFKRDCYLIKYSQKDNAAIITSIGFLRSRAKAQRDCKGWKAGIIVNRGKEIVYSNGLKLAGDELIGGWASGKPEGWDEDVMIEVNLDGYIKKTREGNLTAFWQSEKQPTQIAKVAESQLLRKLWPDEFQNIYTDAEISPDDGTRGLPEIPEDTGQAGEGEAIDPDAHEDFDKMVPKEAKADRVKEFLALVQQSAEKTTFEIKQEAFEHWDEFWSSFLKWHGKKYGAEAKTEPTDKDPIRTKFSVEDLDLYDELKNVRSTSLEARVTQHKTLILRASPEFQDWLKNTKWVNVYKGSRTYPLDKPESPTEDEIAPPGGENEGTEAPPPSAEDKAIMSLIEGSHLDIVNRLCVPCPNRDGRAILFSHCNGGCDERRGCPTFEAYDKK